MKTAYKLVLTASAIAALFAIGAQTPASADSLHRDGGSDRNIRIVQPVHYVQPTHFDRDDHQRYAPVEYRGGRDRDNKPVSILQILFGINNRR